MDCILRLAINISINYDILICKGLKWIFQGFGFPKSLIDTGESLISAL